MGRGDHIPWELVRAGLDVGEVLWGSRFGGELLGGGRPNHAEHIASHAEQAESAPKFARKTNTHKHTQNARDARAGRKPCALDQVRSTQNPAPPTARQPTCWYMATPSLRRFSTSARALAVRFWSGVRRALPPLDSCSNRWCATAPAADWRGVSVLRGAGARVRSLRGRKARLAWLGGFRALKQDG